MKIFKSNPSAEKNIRIKVSTHSNSKDKKNENIKEPSSHVSPRSTSNPSSSKTPHPGRLSFSNKNAQRKPQFLPILNDSTKIKLNLNKRNSKSKIEKPSNFIMKLLFHQKFQQLQNRMQSQKSSRQKQIISIKSRKKSGPQNHALFDPSFSNMTLLKSIYFQIQPTVSVFIDPSTHQQKVSSSTQTAETTLDDKYYLAYKKYRTLKERSFEEMQARQTKIQHIFQETQNFEKNYQDLLSYIKAGPQNDRQRRVFALSVDLFKQEGKIKEIFNQIKNAEENIENQILQKTNLSSKRTTKLIESIKHLIKALIQTDKVELNIKSLKNDQNSNEAKLRRNIRILERTLSQIRHLQQFNHCNETTFYSVLESYHREANSLKAQFDVLTSLQYENRVLLYNFIQRISKVSMLTNCLFGCAKDEEKVTIKAREEDFLNEYMMISCERCYETKKKVDAVKISNSRIQPYFKVAEWLVRDASKEKHLFEFI